MGLGVDLTGRPFHFIGIGGIGMSALARVLLERHLPVFGSDAQPNHITAQLSSLGATIFPSQQAENLTQILRPEGETEACQLPQVICSTAIRADNLEYLAACEQGYPIFHRSDVLAALLEAYESIAIAGTHGKTTTSSMVGCLLASAGLDPTVIIGGEVAALGGNARLGQGKCLVAEADESDGSLAKLHPSIGVITNIELDHPDHYTSLEQVIETFRTFAHQCPVLIANRDCPTLRDALTPTLSYSLDATSGADYFVTEVQFQGDGTQALVWERDQLLGTLQLPVLEAHNLSNALAAIAVGRYLGLEFSAIQSALAEFEGAKRRFEFRGQTNGIQFVDDYAHHPSEISATLASARLQVSTGCSRLPEVPQRVVAIFQPHRYSRTRAFLDEFGRCFTDADVVILTEIYAAGEPIDPTLSGTQVSAVVRQYHPTVYYAATLDDVRDKLKSLLMPGDLALFLGAGNLNQVIPQLLSDYQRPSAIKPL
jgi:UDP-N-acetylmuramate--alanine ligase